MCLLLTPAIQERLFSTVSPPSSSHLPSPQCSSHFDFAVHCLFLPKHNLDHCVRTFYYDTVGSHRTVGLLQKPTKFCCLTKTISKVKDKQALLLVDKFECQDFPRNMEKQIKHFVEKRFVFAGNVLLGSHTHLYVIRVLMETFRGQPLCQTFPSIPCEDEI